MKLKSCDVEQLPELELHTRNEVFIGPAQTSVILESNVTIRGWYEKGHLEMEFGKILFEFDFRGPAPSRQSSLRDAIQTQMGTGKRILIYPARGALQAKARISPHINLALPRSINIELHSGSNQIQSCSIRLRPTTAGLRLRLTESTLHDGDELKDFDYGGENEAYDLVFSRFPPQSSLQLHIPYTLDLAKIGVVTARMEIQYTTVVGRFTYLSTISIDTLLPLNVNVQENFKQTALFSNFVISPANSVPIRLESCKIKNSPRFKIECGLRNWVPLDVFHRQPANFTYRFTPLEESRTGVDEMLELDINFYCYNEVILATIEKQFVMDVEESSLAGLIQLLSPHLKEKHRASWTEQDLEIACLTQRAEILRYDEIDWEVILKAVQPNMRRDAQKWLQQWHLRNTTIPLVLGDATAHQLVIPVDLPHPHLVISTNLNLIQEAGLVGPITVGQPISAQLDITYTDRWRSDAKGDAESETEISYEVMAPADVWLLGGKRKGQSLSGASGRHLAPVILIPQRPGYLLLPSVEVKCFTLDGTEIDAVSGRKRRERGCEVDHRSHAKSVLVVPGARETSISLEGESKIGGTSRMVEIPKKPIG